MINFKKEKHDDNFMLYVPRLKHTNYELDNKGNIKLIFYHDKAIEKVARWLVKKPRVSDVTLDNIGSSVWKLIDGNTSVYDMGQKLLEIHGDSCEPIYERLIMYIRYLNKRGWISFDKGDQ